MQNTMDIVITNKLGLHARAAAKLTQLASRYTDCEIFITRGTQRVNAKSIMGVMMLAAGLGVTVTVDTSGPQAEEVLQAIHQLFEDKFGEPE
ncbi:HPr family phosphocarrier protein [Pusillimonas sp. CC-YST705]|uniref:HPr family phosphocarrier protein n=1 Tax=Mesopusillimonas faecipullorum TaxID=2755040 RepID=A0ABS8CBE9_9BURK|nr:HPr family phosphocarrier protein [Mesopusillimonas faecipullorum]MCB5363351.1 HPr family phosphocarrier protein [Mesopusillimonas faecipullorum]